MTVHTNAKSRLFIGVANNTISELSEFEAEDWLEIKEVEDIGEFGVEGSEQTFLSLADGYVRKLKGSLNSGTLEVIAGRDPSDPGQNRARAAAGDWFKYPFKVELNDKPTPTGTNTIYYFRAPVMSAKSNYGNADNIVKTTFALSIDGAILELPAAPAITMSPAAGALIAGEQGTAYTATVTATGGAGTPAYAVTAGALPAGLALNSATGEISGTPTAAGDYTLTVTATFDGAGTASAAYTLNVAA
ncbi:Ig domain-containing protein [Sphingosinicella soli]|uniref:Uncharacterized protein n=1 Tax=Sphingosinicella soli TaxID=333708 RepID=A0A7W7F712_9SPHN|nr:Ig domain-containing protein [Sphingosinicella soli]MBB4632931.1 hypothetical protein [Sphingosinicella soli]